MKTPSDQELALAKAGQPGAVEGLVVRRNRSRYVIPEATQCSKSTWLNSQKPLHPERHLVRTAAWLDHQTLARCNAADGVISPPASRWLTETNRGWMGTDNAGLKYSTVARGVPIV